MTYKVKTLLPCVGCKKPTNKRRTGDALPQCVDCGVKRMEANVYAQKDNTSEVYRDTALAFIAWCDNGGPERADAAYKWKQGQYRRAERLRKIWGVGTPEDSLADSQ